MEFGKCEGESKIIVNGEKVTGDFFLVIYNGNKSFVSSNMGPEFAPILKVTVAFLPIIKKNVIVKYRNETVTKPFFLIYSNDEGKNVEIFNTIEKRNVLHAAIENLKEARSKEHFIEPDEKVCEDIFKSTI